MCFFIFAITKKPLEVEVMKKYYDRSLYIRDYTDKINDRIEGNYYYDISNGHCACEIVVSPFSKVDELKDLLKDIYNNSPFRFYIFNSDYEDEYLLDPKHQNFEDFLSKLPKENINFEKLYEIYPNTVKYDMLYIVD